MSLNPNKRKLSPSDPFSEDMGLDFEAQPSKKVNLGDSHSLESQVSKELKDEKMGDERPVERGENFKGISSLNIGNMEKHDPSHYKEYKRLKYKNVIYNINDILMIRNCEDANSDFVGILRKIIKVMVEETVNILIEVQWYYRKSDLPKKYGTYFEHISESEVFLTEHRDVTSVETINGACKVLSYEEYEALGEYPPNVFFSRAQYDVVKKKLDPPPEKWQKYCICQKPINPDLLYVQCDKCEKWLHAACIGFTEEQVKNMDSFVCPQCK